MPISTRLVALSAAAVSVAVGAVLLSNGIFRSFSQSSKTSASANADIVTAQVSAQGAPQPLSPDLMCFNVNSVQIASWHEPEFLSAANQLNPKVLRIPGGEVANYWDWQRGGIYSDQSGKLQSLPDGLPEYMRYDARDYTGSQLADYQAGLYATDSKALFVLNMLTSDLGEQIEALSSAAKAGIEIKYIELGNEYFFGIPNYAHKFPTPESYGEEAKVWIQYLRDIFPGVEIAVFGVVPSAESSHRESQWNQALLKTALPEADAITLHIYSRPGLDPTGFSTQGYPAFDEHDFSTVLSQPFEHWKQLRDRPAFKLIPADKEIWITEFNLIEDIFGDNASRLPRVMGSWGHGLYALSMNLMFLEDQRVTLTCNHDLVENYRFGAILPHEDSFQVAPERTFPVVPMSLSASGRALQMVANATDNMNSAQRLDFSDQPAKSQSHSTDAPRLYGWQFESNAANDSRALVLNLSAQIVELDVSEMMSSNAHYQQISADPRTLVTGHDELKEAAGAVQGAIALPPHSVTQISNRAATE